MQVQSLGRKDPLEKGMATYPSILAWRSPWTEEPGGLQSVGHKQSDMTEATARASMQGKFCTAAVLEFMS